MAYCDYDFYKNKYLGNVIAEADFPRLSERASEEIDVLTFDRLVDNFPTDDRLSEKVKKSVCAVAEVLNNIDIAENTYRENGGRDVSSVSSGSESISYGNNSLVGAVLTDKTSQTRLIYSVAEKYLTGTGLLYAGI
jgi:hypothetical protein